MDVINIISENGTSRSASLARLPKYASIGEVKPNTPLFLQEKIIINSLLESQRTMAQKNKFGSLN